MMKKSLISVLIQTVAIWIIHNYYNLCIFMHVYECMNVCAICIVSRLAGLTNPCYSVILIHGILTNVFKNFEEMHLYQVLLIVCPWIYTCTCNLWKKKNIRISDFVNLIIGFPQAIIHMLFFLCIRKLYFSCELIEYTYIVLPVVLILYRSFWPLHSLFLFNSYLDCLQWHYFYLLILQH